MRICLDCGTKCDGPRCGPCARVQDNARYARRGSTKERGLSGAHARMSAEFKRLNLPCVDCGMRGTPANPITAGHIVARANGGRSDPTNYVPQCRSCNSKQGTGGPPRGRGVPRGSGI